MKKIFICFQLIRKINLKGDTLVELKNEVITLPTCDRVPEYNVTEIKDEKDIRKLEYWLEKRDFNAEPKKALLISFQELP